MSLSIRAISRAEFIICNGYVDEEAGECCDHDEATSFPLGREGLKPGCYVPGKAGVCSFLRSVILLMLSGLTSYTG